MADVILHSDLRCPACGHVSREQMPTDYCQYYFECPACGTLVQPKAGDCCVFCSWGSVPCPPVQESDSADGGSCC